MFRHLSKLIAFVGIQVGLFWAVHSSGIEQDDSTTVAALADAPVEVKLNSFLKSRLRPAWDSNPRIIEMALQAGEEHGLIAALVDRFIANSDHYLKAIYDKDRRLRTTPGERLILVGGSHVAFSVDSRLLEERYGLAPVNMGLQSALGLRFMTRHVAEHVRSGDVVVLFIEYSEMWKDPDGQKRAAENFCRVCPEMAWLYHPELKPDSENPAICWDEWKRYGDSEALAEFATMARQDAQRLWPDPPKTAQQLSEADVAAEFERCVQPLLEAAQQRFAALDRVYIRSGFNKYGDMARHRRKSPEERPHYFPSEFAAESVSDWERGTRILNDFAEHCHDRGATVYFAFPTIPRSEATEQLAVEYEAFAQETLKFPILFPIKESLIETDDIYDAAYHLTWNGTCKRMQTLCAGLDRYLKPQTRLTVREHIAARDRTERQSFAVANLKERSQQL